MLVHYNYFIYVCLILNITHVSLSTSVKFQIFKTEKETWFGNFVDFN